MALETASYVANLVTTNPTASDPKSQGDDHIRLLKTTLQNTFAGFAGMVVVTGTESQGSTANDYTVTVTPAPAAYTNSMMVVFKASHANTGAATLQVNSLGTKSLVDVDGNAFASGMIASGALCVAFYDGAKFTMASGNGIKSYLTSLLATYAPLASPTFTGTPTAPTAPVGTTGNQIATMQAVINQAFQTVLPAQSSATAGYFAQSTGASGTVVWAAPPSVDFLLFAQGII